MNYKFMQLAKKTAKKSGCLKKQIGAVLVLNGQVIGVGHNDARPREPYCPREDMPAGTGRGYFYCKTHCGQSHHSETAALYNRTVKECAGAEIYIYGHYVCCEGCIEAMVTHGIETVYIQDDTEGAQLVKLGLSDGSQTVCDVRIR